MNHITTITQFKNYFSDSTVAINVTTHIDSEEVVLERDLSMPLNIPEAQKIKLTKREQAVLRVIVWLHSEAAGRKCIASQRKIGNMAQGYGWKSMSRKMVNEVVARLEDAGLIRKSDRRTLHGRFTTLELYMTDLGWCVFGLLPEKVNYAVKTKKNNFIKKTGHGGGKNRTQRYIKDIDNINSDHRDGAKVEKELGESPDKVPKKADLFSLLSQRGVESGDLRQFRAWVVSHGITDELQLWAMNALIANERGKGEKKSVCGYLVTILRSEVARRESVSLERKQQSMKREEAAAAKKLLGKLNPVSGPKKPMTKPQFDNLRATAEQRAKEWASSSGIDITNKVAFDSVVSAMMKRLENEAI